MKMEIDEKTVSETNRCPSNLDCLNNSKHVFCKVEYCCDNEVHFIKCVNNQDCNYKSSFGYSTLCNCPIRKEIFKKYEK